MQNHSLAAAACFEGGRVADGIPGPESQPFGRMYSEQGKSMRSRRWDVEPLNRCNGRCRNPKS